jgi:hypothetical protein
MAIIASTMSLRRCVSLSDELEFELELELAEVALTGRSLDNIILLSSRKRVTDAYSVDGVCTLCGSPF